MDGRPVPPGPTPRSGRRTRASIAVVLAATFVVGIDASSAIGGSASLERVVDTSAWHHPSPDPTGIARIGSTNRFAVVDGEVEETELWKRSNVWSTRPTLQPLGSWSATRFTFEPRGVQTWEGAGE